VAKAELARAMFWHDRVKKNLKILHFKNELPSLLEYNYLIDDDVISIIQYIKVLLIYKPLS
jgi:hypothetical protein